MSRSLAALLSAVALIVFPACNESADAGIATSEPPRQAATTTSGTYVSKDVPYVPTPQATVDEMLRMAEVDGEDLVYDLGSGDGRIVITAAREFGARGVGIDIDPERISEANENARAAGVTDKVEFIRGDLFQTDLRPATAVTLYLLPSVNLRLRPKLLEELRPGTPVVSHDFNMGDWVPDERKEVGHDDLFLWIIPAKVDGSWSSTVQGSPARTLQLEQTFQMVGGSAGNLQVSNGRLDGDRISFDLADGENAVERYEGRVAGGAIRGTVTLPDGRKVNWTARR